MLKYFGQDFNKAYYFNLSHDTRTRLKNLLKSEPKVSFLNTLELVSTEDTLNAQKIQDIHDNFSWTLFYRTFPKILAWQGKYLILDGHHRLNAVSQLEQYVFVHKYVFK